MYFDIKDWITRISTPTDKIGGLSVCPYSKHIDYKIIEVDNDVIELPNESFEIIIYVFSHVYTLDDLVGIAKTYNKKYPELVFLPDHKDRYTEINGVQTNNGKYNLILCQSRNKLEEARKKLKNTSYYTYWSEEYLKEIFQT